MHKEERKTLIDIDTYLQENGQVSVVAGACA